MSRRAELVASIERDVAFLVERDRFTGLEFVMEPTGYFSTMGKSTSDELGKAIVALAKVIPLWRVRAVAGAAAFERVMQRPNAEDPDGTWRHDHKRWLRADAASQRARGEA